MLYAMVAARAIGQVPAPPLADTEWELVSVQSMDDAIGTTRVEDPSL
jgi:hypothetical protein